MAGYLLPPLKNIMAGDFLVFFVYFVTKCQNELVFLW